MVCSSELPGSGWIDIRIGQQGAKHHTTKAFLPHQRVTTEGKGMQIVVRVTKDELAELGMTDKELNRAVLDDLDSSRDYPGFNVTVEMIEDE